MGADPEFDPAAILGALNHHRVRYVLIGGLAAALHGAAYVTFDVDVTPDASHDNLSRLSGALRALGARIRVEGAPEGVPFAHDATSLAAMAVLNLQTSYGDLDITLTPSGTQGYRDLARGAEERQVLGITVPLAALADVIRSKEAAGRQKDRAALPMLRALLDKTESQRDRPRA